MRKKILPEIRCRNILYIGEKGYIMREYRRSEGWDKVMCQEIIASEIMERIKTGSHDSIYVAADFADLAEYDVVHKTLLELEKTRKIKKIVRGVYYCSQYSKLLQEYAVPSPHKVAEAIARKYGWMIAPCEYTAVYILGLATQVPAKWCYVSSGPYRQIKLGKLAIEYKHRSNWDNAGMSPLTAVVIMALTSIGKENLSNEYIATIRKRLNKSEKTILLREKQHAPAWMCGAIDRICKETNDESKIGN